MSASSRWAINRRERIAVAVWVIFAAGLALASQVSGVSSESVFGAPVVLVLGWLLVSRWRAGHWPTALFLRPSSRIEPVVGLVLYAAWAVAYYLFAPEGIRHEGGPASLAPGAAAWVIWMSAGVCLASFVGRALVGGPSRPPMPTLEREPS